MALNPRNTFITGFLTAVVLWSAWWLYSNWRFQGGHFEDAPSGRYTLMVMAPMEPTSGGTYVVTLTEKATGRLLRRNTIRINSAEWTKTIRGQLVLMRWDATETTVDVTIDGELLIRIAVPATPSNAEMRTNNAMHPSRGSAAS